MKVGRRLDDCAGNGSFVMAIAAAVAFGLYRAAYEVGCSALERYLIRQPSCLGLGPPDPRISWVVLFWISSLFIIPAVLSVLAVALPAMRLRLSPRATFIWSASVPIVPMAFCSWLSFWWSHLVVTGPVSLAVVLSLAWLLARSQRKRWMRHRLRW